MIGVVVREKTYLKVLQPIMEELYNVGEPYILYHYDTHRGDKEYDRASLPNLIKAAPHIIKRAHRVKAFPNDAHLQKQLVHDKITKLVSIEIWLWAKSYIKFLKDHNIKTYSLLYLTDSLWQSDPSCITSMDKVYYATNHLMKTSHEIAGVSFDYKRDRCFGSPVFDGLMNKPSEGNDVLVLLPNQKREHVEVAFGSPQNFFAIMDKLCANKEYNFIFKTRKKQWLPKEIMHHATDIIEDGNQMYPSAMKQLLGRAYTTIMFYSSGIYECVYGGNYVLNITLPLKRWGWDKKQMARYFSTNEHNLYQIKDVVESVSQQQVLSPGWTFQPKRIDPVARRYWVDKFMTSQGSNTARIIVKDILS